MGFCTSRNRVHGGRGRPHRPCGPDIEDSVRHWRTCAQAGRSAVARIPGRYHVDCNRHCDAVRRTCNDARKDVRRPVSFSWTSSQQWAPASCFAIRIARLCMALAGYAGLLSSRPDIRAGMALLIAALCADGRSVINNVGQNRARLRKDRRAPQRTRRGDQASRRPAQVTFKVPREPITEFESIGVRAFTTTQ